jgi:DNA replication ATP-dependent helicase Dna2
VPDPDVHRAIVVDTVERMQGQEREVILVSLATSSPYFAAELADFFFQPQRLNVTITRPRTKLIIVGSSLVLRAEPKEPELVEWVELLRDLLQSCTLHTLTYGEEF